VALNLLHERLAEEFARLRAAGVAGDGLRGLYIDETEVAALLDGPANDMAKHLDAGRLDALVERLNLDPFEVAVLLAAVAAEVEPGYERVYGFLQDDLTQRRPTVGLLLRLYGALASSPAQARDCLHPAAPLLLAGVVSLSDGPQTPLASRAVRVDERVVRHLLGSDLIDERLCDQVRPETRPSDGELTDSALAVLQSAVGVPAIALRGRPGIGKLAAARHVAARTGKDLLVVDVANLLHDAAPALLVRLIMREALLLDAAVYWSGAEPLWSAAQLPLLHTIEAQATAWRPVCLFGGAAQWEPPPRFGDQPVRVLSLPMPTAGERYAAWTATLAAHGVDGLDEVAESLAAGFSLTTTQIADAAVMACAAVGATEDAETWWYELHAAARAVSGRRLATLGTELVPRADWTQLVLPEDSMEQLQELCATVRNHHLVLDSGFRQRLTGGTGVTALFSGVSGTGKTMAAEVIAGELGLALFRIDLAGVVSKWIGETEKNLDLVFGAAADSNAILFFDEADALFGKRSEVKDSHDRYANLEVSYLLQKMEEYDGVAILATNMRHQMDDAFLRRLTFNVVFPLPEADDRVRIWAAAWPALLPAADDVDFARLGQVRLVGGNIKNIILAAAHRALGRGRPVAMADLVHGIRREFQKLGEQLSEADILADLPPRE